MIISLHKQRILKVVALMSVFIIATTVFFISANTFGGNNDQGAYQPTPPGSPPPPTNISQIPRDARTSANPHIRWEQNIGGNLNDYAKAIFDVMGYYFVIGQTSSTTHDFMGLKNDAIPNLFISKLNKSGRLLEIVVINSGVAEHFVRAFPYGQGFKIIANRDTSAIFYIFCVAEKRVIYHRAFEGQAKDAFLDSDRLAIIVFETNRISINFIQIESFYREDYTITILKNGRNLYYAGFIPHLTDFYLSGGHIGDGFLSGQYLLVLNHTNQNRTNTLIYKVTEENAVLSLTLNNLFANQILPYRAGGFLLAGTESTHNPRGRVFAINNMLMQTALSYTSTNINVTRMSVVHYMHGYIIITEFVGSNNMGYANINVVCMNLRITHPYINDIPNFPTLSCFIPLNNNWSNLILTFNIRVQGFSGILVIRFSENAIKSTQHIGGTSNDTLTRSLQAPGNAITILASTTSTSKDIGTNHGLSDLWLARIIYL
ncbi:MAG: hypothetical protein FWB72_06750 [Firmicutes bacterium]|nr:hypothetical protein [Bacillota bacterium]